MILPLMCVPVLFLWVASNKKQLNQLVYDYLEHMIAIAMFVRMHAIIIRHVGALIGAHFLNLYDL